MKDLSAIGQFVEIEEILSRLPGPDKAAEAAARARQDRLTKPRGSLGRLEELAAWAARWQGRELPNAARAYTAVFVANHGVAARGVSAYPAEVTKQMLANFIAGGAAINQICGMQDADLRVYEMALDEPTADFTEAPAMSEEECVRAIAYGMMAVEGGIDIMALGEMGIANTTSAAALCHALFGGAVEDWVGRGTGVDDPGFAVKTQVVRRGVELHGAAATGPLDLLRRLGGRELAAIAGAVIAARLARTPVLLDGYACTAAAAVLYAIDPTLLEHCQVAHLSTEPGHDRLLQRIDRRPLLNLQMRLGEATGAALALSLVRAACACHSGMATFEEAGVSGPDRG